ncbi:hypothetical protein [Streptomyces tendae]
MAGVLAAVDVEDLATRWAVDGSAMSPCTVTMSASSDGVMGVAALAVVIAAALAALRIRARRGRHPISSAVVASGGPRHR